jgi:MacB-like periplasmic core domain/FtsX-like permease family
MPVVLTGGRMPASGNEIVLAPATARKLDAATGSTVRLTGGPHPQTLTVTGIGFVHEAARDGCASGAWVTPAGYDQLFSGARYAFKFRDALVTLRPGADVQEVARRLNAAAARIKGGQAFRFGPTPRPEELQEVKDVAVLLLVLSGFLALLALGAVGHALAIAVRRRRSELAVLRTLGMTRRQSRLVVTTPATVLALIGLVFGVPLGIALGRTLWRVVADGTPLAYHPPLAA